MQFNHFSSLKLLSHQHAILTPMLDYGPLLHKRRQMSSDKGKKIKATKQVARGNTVIRETWSGHNRAVIHVLNLSAIDFI